MSRMRSRSIPLVPRYSEAARARRSPSAVLYSLVPRSSQCPSMSSSCLGFALSHAALASRILASAGRTLERSKSKWMSFSARWGRY